MSEQIYSDLASMSLCGPEKADQGLEGGIISGTVATDTIPFQSSFHLHSSLSSPCASSLHSSLSCFPPTHSVLLAPANMEDLLAGHPHCSPLAAAWLLHST